MIDWLRRRVILLGDRRHGALYVGDFLELWWRPRKGGGQIRGVILRGDPPVVEGFLVGVSRYYATFCWTDHQTYIVARWGVQTANFQRLLSDVAGDPARV